MLWTAYGDYRISHISINIKQWILFDSTGELLKGNAKQCALLWFEMFEISIKISEAKDSRFEMFGEAFYDFFYDISDPNLKFNIAFGLF